MPYCIEQAMIKLQEMTVFKGLINSAFTTMANLIQPYPYLIQPYNVPYKVTYVMNYVMTLIIAPYSYLIQPYKVPYKTKARPSPIK